MCVLYTWQWYKTLLIWLNSFISKSKTLVAAKLAYSIKYMTLNVAVHLVAVFLHTPYYRFVDDMVPSVSQLSTAVLWYKIFFYKKIFLHLRENKLKSLLKSLLWLKVMNNTTCITFQERHQNSFSFKPSNIPVKRRYRVAINSVACTVHVWYSNHNQSTSCSTVISWLP